VLPAVIDPAVAVNVTLLAVIVPELLMFPPLSVKLNVLPVAALVPTFTLPVSVIVTAPPAFAVRFAAFVEPIVIVVPAVAANVDVLTVPVLTAPFAVNETELLALSAAVNVTSPPVESNDIFGAERFANPFESAIDADDVKLI
jgi:hypothetical protein